MEKLSDIIRDIIYRTYLYPKLIFENKIDRHFKENLKDKSSIISFLLLVITLTYVLPMFILLNDLSIESKSIYSILYLSICFFGLIGASGFLDAKKMLETKIHKNDANKLKYIIFKTNLDLESITSNLVNKYIFECNIVDLKKALTNEIPTFKINNIYIGGSGKVSYHAIFFLFHYLIKGGINDLSPKALDELFNYITSKFLKNGETIKIERLKQSYDNWLLKKYCSDNARFFVKDYLS
ncbi:hypothetical protein UMM65_13715 [Aureibaculum sp. 2210JD6-5]|uniref:hypothetical protein n=1 Tax=Aureibaculum sp. 2210JD6-5 TaxID=3103957 RepID=UPI002AAD1BE4|nr:hypothetical protein [Aureibaculum sp. 2210JD6-5]MDY7396303.1 hypothetical protein [Aureibaculum sp. 2210JD6-5]